MKREELLASLDIGSSIKRLREKKGLSQEELAKGICDRTNITKLENGHSKIPSLSFILLICERLEVTIDEFLNFSMSNNYSLDKKRILDLLMSNDIGQLQNYLNNISFNLLSRKDSKYYTYLSAKIAIYNNELSIAKQHLLSIIKEIKSSSYDCIDVLSIHELIKNKFSNNLDQLRDSIYSSNNINKLINKSSNIEYIYLINDLIEFSISNNDIVNAKYLLEKEIQFINVHDCYRYLPFYYKNKIRISHDDTLLVKDLENKLFAIQTGNKHSI